MAVQHLPNAEPATTRDRLMADSGVSRHGERVRSPRPVIARRVASGRGATEQPNACGDGEAVLGPRFWAMLVLTGVTTGLFAIGLMALLFTTEHLAFGYSEGSLQAGVEHASALRRITSLAVGGAFAGVAWSLLRRYTGGQRSEIDNALWTNDTRLSPGRSLGTSVISELVVGMGASLGREAAPKLMGGVCGSVLGRWARLSTAQQRLLIAGGGGAGLAAVYNVPLGGALFTAEVLCGSIQLPVVLPALACSWIATLVGWLYLPSGATYLAVPSYPFDGSEMVWALLAGPVIGLVAVGFIRLVAWVSHHRPTGWFALVAPLPAFLVLGGVGLWLPQLFGNGKGITQHAFIGSGGLVLLAALAALKPLLTALCIGSGASGGLFTPTMSTGAALGGFLGVAWSLVWPGAPTGAYAMIGAAAMIGASMQAPLAGLALVLELTHSGFQLMVPMVAATVLATAVVRYLDGYSIYSARLPGRPAPVSATPAP
jgi:chloride channel protein, CIC family